MNSTNYFTGNVNNCWVNNREAGYLRRHRTHHNITVIFWSIDYPNIRHHNAINLVCAKSSMIILRISLPPLVLKIKLNVLTPLSRSTIAILMSWKLRRVWTNSKTLTSDPSAQRKLIKNWNPLTLKKLLGVTISQVKSYAWHTMSYQVLWLHWLTIVSPTFFLILWKWRTSVPITRNMITWQRETTCVSVLTTLSKLYESAMNDQLLCYFASIFNDPFVKDTAVKPSLLNVLKTGNQHMTKKSMSVSYSQIYQRHSTVCHTDYCWLNSEHMALIPLLVIW